MGRETNYAEVSAGLRQYVESEILPRYDSYDKAHSRRHILSVMEHSMELYRKLSSEGYALNPDMVYTIAAYHDLGVCEGRKLHHIVSGRMLEEDSVLPVWFSPEQIHVMKEAVEDHRSSNSSAPRSIYGRIVSEADKELDFDIVFSRAILYARASNPEASDEEIFRISYGHLVDKYGDGGYMRLQFENSPNTVRLERLRAMLRDPAAMRREFSLFEVHPLEPFVPENAGILLLGSFPPPKARWSMDFFYPNFINDMWRIMGIVYFGDKDRFVVPGQKKFDREKIVEFCTGTGIALYDAAYMVKREKGNASDNHLRIMEPTDIRSMLGSMPSCVSVVSTGGKSAGQIAAILDVPVPAVGGSVQVPLDSGRTVTFFRMPSSSRAYPLSLEAKAAAYAKVLPAVK